MMQRQCPKDYEVGCYHSWFVRCERPEGHAGRCFDTRDSREWYTRPATVSAPVDANGSPL